MTQKQASLCLRRTLTEFDGFEEENNCTQIYHFISYFTVLLIKHETRVFDSWLGSYQQYNMIHWCKKILTNYYAI